MPPKKRVLIGRRTIHAIRVAKLRATETDQQRKSRLEYNRVQAARSRQAESEEKRKMRLALNRARASQYRQTIKLMKVPCVNESDGERRHSTQCFVEMKKKITSESNTQSNSNVIFKHTSTHKSKSTPTKQDPPTRKWKFSTCSETLSNDDAFDNADPLVSQENKRPDYSDNEYDAFGKLIAMQLRQFPLYNAITCQERIQLIIKRQRLLELSSQEKIKQEPSTSPLHCIKAEIYSDIEISSY